MVKTFYYAIKNTNQVVNTWDECKAIVIGLPKAQYKKFSTLEEANAFLEGKVVKTKQPEVVPYENEQGIKGTIRLIEDTDPFTLNLYGTIFVIDGSFNSKTGVYGGGVAIYDSKKNLLNTSTIHGNREDFAVSRNVAGEVIAFANAIALAGKVNLKSITVVCDYEGIVRWSAPKSVYVRNQKCWGTNDSSPISAYMGSVLRGAKSMGIDTIHFVWVRSHTGIKVNDLVDTLAKKAVGIE